MYSNEKEFFAGAIWAASAMYRMHTDSVVVKDLLNELPNVHEVAKNSAEYDIQPLRLFVMNSLPLGYDATYQAISYGPINSHGELICDHSDANHLTESDYESYGVFAIEENDSKIMLVVDMATGEEAEGLAEILSAQLREIAEVRGEEKIYPSYDSKLGDALFPKKEDENYFELEARNFASELLHKYDGNINSAKEFLELLECFTPERIQDVIDNPIWSTESEVNRWNNIIKPMIINKVKQFFDSELKNNIL
ncbi:hypothetical protein [Xenorhabdus sp. KJ12.1]|uniref:hypothetical protein n=1 Tax=Xenorhabdus sp. KJ12.1 TaxID=1851571 RepID=UPI000C05D1D3|nr:hypothetical protein [Xenorhabdus sp. KJ12.1]PHM72309.1 hypothetical protein Xekj_00587 [Xenorhabdus sp. KJ12.1]